MLPVDTLVVEPAVNPGMPCCVAGVNDAVPCCDAGVIPPPINVVVSRVSGLPSVVTAPPVTPAVPICVGSVLLLYVMEVGWV